MTKVVDVLIVDGKEVLDRFPIEGVIFDKKTGILTIRKRTMQHPTNKDEVKNENI